MDKFEPVSGDGDMDHAEEAFRGLVVAGCDRAADVQAPEEAFDLVSFPEKRPVMLDFNPAA